MINGKIWAQIISEGTMIITRKDAISKGLSYYYTGIPCKMGHLAKRHVTGCVCVECIKEHSKRPESKKRARLYRARPEQREKSKAHSKRYHRENRPEVLKKMQVRNAAYYENNKERIKAQTLAYQKENAATRTPYKREWSKSKRDSDPAHRMMLVMRRMLYRALGIAGQVKYKRTQDYLPYTSEQLSSHLEKQFVDGMTWANYGEWHIDHITPLSVQIKNGITDPAIINGLENLQPLWAKDNMQKGYKT